MSDSNTAPQELAQIADQLGEAVHQALPSWVVRCVTERYVLWSGASALSNSMLDEAKAAGQTAQQEQGQQIRAVLSLDIDEQQVPPLSLLRQAVKHPTRVLQNAGVPPVVRDEFAERNFPNDLYDLNPANFADVDPGLHELGMAWGAAKAFVHLQRRRR